MILTPRNLPLDVSNLLRITTQSWSTGNASQAAKKPEKLTLYVDNFVGYDRVKWSGTLKKRLVRPGRARAYGVRRRMRRYAENLKRDLPRIPLTPAPTPSSYPRGFRADKYS
jgi:hypothetical protein